MGAMICFDREQPESARILMIKGAELILTPNACILAQVQINQFQYVSSSPPPLPFFTSINNIFKKNNKNKN